MPTGKRHGTPVGGLHETAGPHVPGHRATDAKHRRPSKRFGCQSGRRSIPSRAHTVATPRATTRKKACEARRAPHANTEGNRPDSARKAPTTSPMSHFRRRTTRKGGDGRCATSCGQSDVSVAKAPHNVRCRAQSWTHCGSVRSRSNRFRQACAKTPLDRRPTHCRTHGRSGEGAAFAHDRNGSDRGCGAIRAERSRGRQCPQSSSTETPSWGAHCARDRC